MPLLIGELVNYFTSSPFPRVREILIGKKEAYMRNRSRFAASAFLCSFAVLFLFACGGCGGGNSTSSNTGSHYPFEGINTTPAESLVNPLVGTWSGGGRSLTFNRDNTYSADVNQEGIPRVWGTITVSGNLMMITDREGPSSCVTSAAAQDGGGSYTYVISGNTLSFSLFHDSCGRRIVLLSPFFSKQ
jgi:hypothetical protein